MQDNYQKVTNIITLIRKSSTGVKNYNEAVELDNLVYKFITIKAVIKIRNNYVDGKLIRQNQQGLIHLILLHTIKLKRED